jgi:hypothetical protein
LVKQEKFHKMEQTCGKLTPDILKVKFFFIYFKNTNLFKEEIINFDKSHFDFEGNKCNILLVRVLKLVKNTTGTYWFV